MRLAGVGFCKESGRVSRTVIGGGREASIGGWAGGANESSKVNDGAKSAHAGEVTARGLAAGVSDLGSEW